MRENRSREEATMIGRSILTGLYLLGLLGSWAAVGAVRGDGEGAIRQVLDRQTEAWNRGDLEGYMQGYWKSPDLTFYSGGTITGGWEATLARYRRRYQSEGKEMGRLDFPGETIDLLGPDSAVARGRWRLVFSDGKQSTGLYTVILRRLPAGWRIVHDHSSAD
jgi:ketosteroid isomerase-like protein